LGVNGGVVHVVGSVFLGVKGGVVHGRDFESDFWGVNGGVVHGHGFESLAFGVSGGVVHVVGSNLCLFPGQCWCSALNFGKSACSDINKKY
jgi:hypothetical protein